ncbi:hypothetical protein Fcan01_17109 [Folsomia candida]|uniref:Uncharacterized protein n=2 Tax=Folsomia candida TaxID=158441 RepID=A0A226DT51_FOLCA|nr:hypothetical protein Fcan01_17109 [Folsomia candida]
MCTQVNAGWEVAARNHLRARILIDLSAECRKSYLNVMAVRANYHQRIELSWKREEKFVQFLPRFKHFAEQSRGKLRHVSTEFFLGGGPYSEEFFQIIKTLGTQVTSLNLKLFCAGHNKGGSSRKRKSMSSFLTDFHPGQNLVFPSITKLGLNLHQVTGCDAFPLILAKLAALFPNVSTLGYHCGGGDALKFLFFTKPSPVRNLVSLCLRESMSHGHYNGLPVSPARFTSNITRFEFNVTRQISPWPVLLQTFSPVLEHLRITGLDERRFEMRWGDVKELVIPIMPKLKFFAISRITSIYDTNLNEGLKFETASPLGKIDYKRQFPALQVLSVNNVGESGNEFESTVKFLYESFLPENISVCETLRELYVPHPPRDKSRLRETTFVDRIVATFPNLKFVMNLDQFVKG